MLDSQGRHKRQLKLRHYLLAAILALVIDYAFLHSGAHILHFDVPENELYFISKFAVILGAVFLFHRIRNALFSILATGFIGSGIFSVYYALVRPDLFGIADSAVYSDYPITFTLEQSLVIYFVHAVGISIGYAVALLIAKKQKRG